MTITHSLKITRPFATLEDFLENDSWTVSRSELVLIHPDMPAEGTLVGFEIGLDTGQVLVRGEGSVVGPAEKDGAPTQGFRVRLRKLYASSKTVLKSALERQRAQKAAQEQAEERARDQEATSQPEEPPDLNRSGVHQVAARIVEPPPNREELLRRLRERAQRLFGSRADVVDELKKAAS